MFKRLSLCSLFVISSLFCMQKEFNPSEYQQEIVISMENALEKENYYDYNSTIKHLREYLATQDPIMQITTCLTLLEQTNNLIIKGKLLLIAMDICRRSYNYQKKALNPDCYNRLFTYVSQFTKSLDENGITSDNVQDLNQNANFITKLYYATSSLCSRYLTSQNPIDMLTDPEKFTGSHNKIKHFVRRSLSKPDYFSKDFQRLVLPPNAPATHISDTFYITGCTNGQIKIRTKNRNIKTLTKTNEGQEIGHTDRITALDTYSERFLISASDDDTIKVWDIKPENGACVQTILTQGVYDRYYNVTALAAGYRSLMVAGTQNGSLWILKNLNHCKEDVPFYKSQKEDIQIHEDRISALIMADNSHAVSSSFDATSRMIDLETAKTIFVKKHNNIVNANKKGALYYASLINKSVVELWNLQQQSPITKIQDGQEVITTLEINCVNIATALDDGTINIWDIRYLKPFQTLSTGNKQVKALSFQKNNKLLALTADNTLHKFSLYDNKEQFVDYGF